MPEEEATLLEFVVAFLRNVATHQEKNLMTFDNLSISIGPSIIPIGKDITHPGELLGLTKRNNQLVMILLQNHELIFANVKKQVWTEGHRIFRAVPDRRASWTDSVVTQIQQFADEIGNEISEMTFDFTAEFNPDLTEEATTELTSEVTSEPTSEVNSEILSEVQPESSS
eukprot:TRINITY_DN8427_c0_g1_i2.p1 TRINITY_DN8427_c0_g1~~TRINITY_DN8427_c0_g1_i2.p1  ORF type:complete len:170 (+),score=33.38 TRINITY_DN8427_c0_g1_i2:847-1356(+)